MSELNQLSTREATLTALLRHGQCDATSLASAMSISVQAMRRQLRRMECEGLVEANAICVGPGRPSNQWKLTTKGQNHFNNASETYALELMSSIKNRLNIESSGDIFKDQLINKVNYYRKRVGIGKLDTRLRKLVDLRNEEGYYAELLASHDGFSWELRQSHCSIRKIAEKFPLVCDQELELIRYTFPDCIVQRLEWRLVVGNICGFQITPKDTND